jgi:molecular chaperone HtpG
LPPQKRILELNPDHQLVTKMQALASGDPKAEQLGHYAELLFGQALISEGSALPNPSAFTEALTATMLRE